eukprot:COSAG06_NODE_9912_length_1791_cov_2.522459_1_plen_121_part_10
MASVDVEGSTGVRARTPVRVHVVRERCLPFVGLIQNQNLLIDVSRTTTAQASIPRTSEVRGFDSEGQPSVPHPRALFCRVCPRGALAQQREEHAASLQLRVAAGHTSLTEYEPTAAPMSDQ